jgi:diacylglycerol kinase (ATP)
VEALQEDSYDALSQSIGQALLKPAFALIVVGGDGMVHLGVEHALRAQVPLGVIPTGTGNDFARHLGIPLGGVTHAVAHFVAATETSPIRVDVGVATSASGVSRAYACVASAGFDAIVNQRANSLKFPKGRHRYTLALLIELAKLRPRHYTVTLDSSDLSGEYMLVAVANSQSFGGGMKVAPEASLNDGLLDVLLVKPLSRLAFLRIYPRVFKGTHVTDRRVIIRQAQSVSLDAEGIVAYADGEPVGPLPLSVSVSGAALSVFA